MWSERAIAFWDFEGAASPKGDTSPALSERRATTDDAALLAALRATVKGGASIDAAGSALESPELRLDPDIDTRKRRDHS